MDMRVRPELEKHLDYDTDYRPEGAGYSPTEVSRRVGVNYNTLLYWLRHGLLQAAVHQGKPWAPVVFTPEQVAEARLVKVLRDHAIDYEAIREAVKVARRANGRAYLRVENGRAQCVGALEAHRILRTAEAPLLVNLRAVSEAAS